MSRPLVGQFQLSVQGDVQFESGAVQYRCELVEKLTSLEVLLAVARSEFVVIRSWHWSTNTVLVVDARAVECTTQLSMAHGGACMFSAVSADKVVSGSIVSMSALLRIKNESDPFHNSFVVRLDSGKLLICRNRTWWRYLFGPGDSVAITGLKKVKLGMLTNVYVTSDASEVGQYHHGPMQGEHALVRVVQIAGGLLLVSVLSDAKIISPVILSVQFWGLCDRRRVCVGAVLRILNFHVVDAKFILCPATTSVTVEEFPPIAVGTVNFFSLAEASKNACILHAHDVGCRRPSSTKFSINSLCLCDCVLHCSPSLVQVKEELLDETDDAKKIQSITPLTRLFMTAMADQELCLSLLSPFNVFLHQAPPFFNVSFVAPVVLESKGSPSGDVAKALKALPVALYHGLFPPSKPLNAYSIYRLRDAENPSHQDLLVLIARSFRWEPIYVYAIKQLLVLDTNPTASVHAIVQRDDTILPIGPADKLISPGAEGIVSTVRTKLSRRLLLRNRLMELGF